MYRLMQTYCTCILCDTFFDQDKMISTELQGANTKLCMFVAISKDQLPCNLPHRTQVIMA